jgi:hypothetical protein
MSLHVKHLQAIEIETQVETNMETALFLWSHGIEVRQLRASPPQPPAGADHLWGRVPDNNPFTVLTIRREAYWLAVNVTGGIMGICGGPGGHEEESRYNWTGARSVSPHFRPR